MEKMKKNSKGFTIVELVIVIALIAILAAVLIPTFSNVINNAHESNDTIMVKNLNTILNAEEVKGNRADTMQEALDQAEEGGYKVEKLTPASTGDILWDQKSNRFLLVNKKGEVVFRDESVTDEPDFTNKAYLYWKITKNAESDKAKGYSLYLDKNYNNLPETMTVTAGLDVGVHALSAVTYQNNAAGAKVQDVIIRTNGGTLTVNAPQDTVRRFGTADKVVIERIASASYHEYGEVLGTIEVKSGHVQVENGAKVGSIIASAAAGAAAAEVTAASGSEIGTVVVNDGSVTVTVKSGATVAEVAPGKDVTIDNGKITGITPSQTAIDTTKTSLFAGGVGTEASPYVITNETHWENLVKECENDTGYTVTKGKHYIVKRDLDVSGIAPRANIAYFGGSIDFENHSITGFTAENTKYDISYDTEHFVGIFSNISGNVTIENLDFETCAIKPSATDTFALQVAVALDGEETDCVVTFRNITMKGNAMGLTGNNNGLLLSYGYKAKSGKIFVENCTNYASIVGGGYKAAFIGNIGYGRISAVSFKNCNNYGTIISTANNAGAAMLISNQMYPKVACEITVENCSNQGKIISAGTNAALLMNCAGACQNITLNGEDLNGKAVGETRALFNTAVSGIKGANLSAKELTVDANDNFVLEKTENAKKYVLLFSFTAGNRAGGNVGYSLTFAENELPATFKAGNWITKSEAESTGEQIVVNNKYGTTYYTCGNSYVFYEDGAKIYGTVFVTFISYSEADELLSIATYEYPKK